MRFARLRRNSLLWLGSLLLAVLVLVIVAAPLLTPFAPDRLDVLDMLSAPSSAHPFGTDLFGRDLLARVLYGGRTTLVIGIGVITSAFVVGVAVGTLAGFCGGWVDSLLMRLVDALLSFPTLVVAIALAAAFGASLVNAMLAVSIALAPQFARVARVQAVHITASPYVEAARGAGVSAPRLFVHYVLRNGLTPLLTQATLSIGSAILQTASLGFLGLGAQPPAPEWGADIAFNLDYVRSDPWVVAAPGLAILLTVLAFNLIGEALAEQFNPRLAVRR